MLQSETLTSQQGRQQDKIRNQRQQQKLAQAITENTRKLFDAAATHPAYPRCLAKKACTFSHIGTLRTCPALGSIKWLKFFEAFISW